MKDLKLLIILLMLVVSIFMFPVLLTSLILFSVYIMFHFVNYFGFFGTMYLVSLIGVLIVIRIWGERNDNKRRAEKIS